MDSKCSLQCLQKPAIGPNSEEVKFSTYFVYVRFIYYFPSNSSYTLQVVSFPWIFWLKVCILYILHALHINSFFLL
jgi:hypothetical protein